MSFFRNSGIGFRHPILFSIFITVLTLIFITVLGSIFILVISGISSIVGVSFSNVFGMDAEAKLPLSAGISTFSAGLDIIPNDRSQGIVLLKYKKFIYGKENGR